MSHGVPAGSAGDTSQDQPRVVRDRRRRAERVAPGAVVVHGPASQRARRGQQQPPS